MTAESAASIPLTTQNRNPSESRSTKTFQRISWKGRHASLDTKWHQKDSTRKTIGAILLTVGVALAAATVVAALTFVATPAVVIGAVSTLATCTALTLIPGIVFLSLSKSWNDPKHRIEMGQKAAKAIVHDNLSYPQIRQRYGRQIDRYQILNNQDINLFLRRDAQNLTYRAFRERHGTDFLMQLDNRNQRFLRNRFLDMVKPTDQPMVALPTLLNDYAVEIQAFRITAEEISALLEEEVEDLSFAEFKEKHGIAFLAENWPYHAEGEPPAKLLSEESRSSLKASFFDHLQETKTSLSDARINFATEIRLLNISESDIKSEVVTNEMKRVMRGELKYLEFLKRNEGNGVRLASKNFMDECRQGLICELREDTIGLVEMRSKYQADLDALEIGLQELVDITIFRDYPKLASGNLSYKEFRARHGKLGLEFLNNVQRLEAKKAFLQMSYDSMKSDSYAEDQTLLSVTKEEIFTALKNDLNTLPFISFDLENRLSSACFLAKHGTSWTRDSQCQRSDKDKAIQKMQESLKGQCYPVIKEFFHVLNFLQPNREQIAQFLHDDMQTLSFEAFIKKHGQEWVQQKEFIQALDHQALLQKKTLEYTLAHASDSIAGKAALDSLINHHQLLSPKARLEVENHRQKYHQLKQQQERELEGINLQHQTGIQLAQQNLAIAIASLGQTESRLNDARMSHQGAVQQLQRHHRKKAVLESEITQLRQELHSAQGQVSNAPVLINQLRERIDPLSAERQRIASTPVQGLANASAANRQIGAIDRQLNEIRNQVSALENLPNRIQQLEVSLRSKYDELRTNGINISFEEGRINRFKQDIPFYQAQYDQALIGLRQIEASVNNAIAQQNAIHANLVKMANASHMKQHLEAIAQFKKSLNQVLAS